jgi:hypothetical protein
VEEKRKKSIEGGIVNKLLSVNDWKKYPLVLTTMFLIVLWRVTAVTMENKINELQGELNRCQEARTADAKERTTDDRRILDRYIEQSLQRSTEKIIQPKLDSIHNL